MSTPTGTRPTTPPRIRPCLWFDGGLEDAASFYASVFPDSEVGHLTRTPDGRAVVGEWRLGDTSFQAIDGGPELAGFTPAISFSITCADQAEVDHYWSSLTADGGEESMCGWLVDRFGLSWQVVPSRLFELLSDPDPARAAAAQQSMLGMRRIVVAELEAAADAAGTGL
jgi:predicted 3-demethylubiquinone-9 3-methyltransferase (glyoxalase superfamily)